MIRYTVDRIEGHIAVLLKRDDESIVKHVPIALLPEKIQDGDIVMEEIVGEHSSYTILIEETKSQREKAVNLLEKLKNKFK